MQSCPDIVITPRGKSSQILFWSQSFGKTYMFGMPPLSQLVKFPFSTEPQSWLWCVSVSCYKVNWDERWQPGYIPHKHHTSHMIVSGIICLWHFMPLCWYSESPNKSLLVSVGCFYRQTTMKQNGNIAHELVIRHFWFSWISLDMLCDLWFVCRV